MTEADDQTRLELLEQAARTVITSQFSSTSTVQRNLQVPYATAVHLMDELHRYGIVGPARGTQARDVLVARDQLSTVVDQIRGVV